MCASYNYKQPLSLSGLCEDYFVKYIHHVVWRQLDPPSPKCHSCFQPTEFGISSKLPPKRGPTKDPKLFRQKLSSIRRYIGDNLVRPVHENLSNHCHKFVSENRLRYGDVLLYLIFQDGDSTSLRLNAKQIIFKKWKTREKMSLIRTLRDSNKLVKLAVPGKVDDNLLFVIAKNCRLLEDIDISNSYISDKGVLSLCGVIIKDIKSNEKCDILNQTIEIMSNFGRNQRKLARGRTVSKELEDSFSLLASKMKPYFDKKLGIPEADNLCWNPSRGTLYKFNSKYGCPRLRKIDLIRTGYPKRTLDVSGNLIVNCGVTRDSILTILILLDNLMELKWNELGDMLELYHMLVMELCPEGVREKMKLNLVHLMDISTTLEKLEAAAKYCPNLVKLELSMFNFSSYYDDIALNMGDVRHDSENRCHWIDLIFSFKHLKDIELQFMDDNEEFKNNIR